MGIDQRRLGVFTRSLVQERTSTLVELLTGDESWPAVSRLWNEILVEIPNPSPYWTWEYVDHWRKGLGTTCPKTGAKFESYTAVVRREGKVVGIFPLFVERKKGLRRLRLLGFNGGFGPADMTEEPLYLIAPGCDRFAWEGLSQAIRTLRKRRVFDMIDLRLWVRGSDDPPIGLPFRQKKGPAIAEVPESWAAYRSLLTKSMRDNIGYYPRLLARHGHSFQIRHIVAPEEMSDAVETLVDLHKKRHAASKDVRRVDHFPTETEAKFQASALARLAEQNRAFVAFLEIDGRPAAAQAFLGDGQTLLMGYSGFDPEWAAYSPLIVLQASVFQNAIENGVRRLDFQQGDRSWQTRWQAKPEGRILGITVVRKNPLALGKAFFYFAKREISKSRHRRRLSQFWQRIVERHFVLFGVDLSQLDRHLAEHAVRLGHLACHPVTTHLLHVGRRI